MQRTREVMFGNAHFYLNTSYIIGYIPTTFSLTVIWHQNYLLHAKRLYFRITVTKVFGSIVSGAPLFK